MSERPDMAVTKSWRRLLLPAALVAAWALAGAAGFGNPRVFVPIDAVGRAGLDAIASGELPGAIGATIARAIIGWSVGALFGFAIGLVLGVSAASARFASPTLHGARQIALFAWIPLISAWLGNGEAMKLTLIALSAFFPVFLHVEAGCRQVPLAYREVGQLLSFSRATEIACIILPAAVPTIVAGLELAFAVAWIGTVGAEYLIGTGYMYAFADGIGAFLAGARENARMDLVVVGILSLALAGFALDRAVVLASRRVLGWRPRSR